MVMEVEYLDTVTAGEYNFQSLYSTNLFINIEMLPCPFGFEYHNTSMMCTCDSKLVEYKINCSIGAQTVWRRVHFGSLQQKNVVES